jgi:pterin-4a-carbinolamine dehydratase
MVADLGTPPRGYDRASLSEWPRLGHTAFIVFGKALSMNENLIFISYRRVDASPQSLALRLELETRLKAANVFLDTGTIEAGSIWSSSIEDALRAANVILVLVGRLWLKPDHTGKRRIDDPQDWVRKEVRFALESKATSILPILIDGAPGLREEELPDDLKGLARIQAARLSIESWNRDIDALLSTFRSKFSFYDKSTSYTFPIPDPLKARTIPVEWNELQNQIAHHMPLWSLEFSDDPIILNHKRIELTRNLTFSNFQHAMDFVQIVAEHAAAVDHHPRWMNVWTTLTIWLSTWDAGGRVTSLDIQFARVIERKYEAFMSSGR